MHADGRTDGETDMTMMGSSRSFVFRNSPKN